MNIHLTPEQIDDVASQIRSRAGDIQQAAASADSSVGTIREMQSPRLVRNITAWDDLKGNIQKAVEALQELAQEMNKLAEANRIANQ